MGQFSVVFTVSGSAGCRPSSHSCCRRCCCRFTPIAIAVPSASAAAPLVVVVPATTAPVTVAPATATAASIVAASVVVAAAPPSAVPPADGLSLLAIHAGRLSSSRLAAALANVDAPWLVAAGVSAITAAAPTVGPLRVAVGPELPAIHTGRLFVPRPRPAGLLAMSTSAPITTPGAAAAASPLAVIAPFVPAATPRAAAAADVPVATHAAPAGVVPVAPPAPLAAPAAFASAVVACVRVG